MLVVYDVCDYHDLYLSEKWPVPVLAFRTACFRIDEFSGHPVTAATAATEDVVVPDLRTRSGLFPGTCFG